MTAHMHEALLMTHSRLRPGPLGSEGINDHLALQEQEVQHELFPCLDLDLFPSQEQEVQEEEETDVLLVT